MKKWIYILLMLPFSLWAQEKYHRVKVFIPDSQKAVVYRLPIAIDHGERGRNYIITDLSESEIQQLEAHNISYRIIIQDVSNYYQQQNQTAEHKLAALNPGCSGISQETFPTPEHWSLGSMGGFFTYEEFLAHLDTMAAAFPNLITVRDTIGSFSTHEGRPIYYVKISDNANVDENEPEVLFTALHHSREPASLSQLIYFMYYLLENYGTNEEVTYLVDHLEMYFIPMVNPDGYIYNQTTDPNGGGMWRKNRRNNGDGTYGVDLNRNYGYKWGLDDNGSSPNTNSDTYRGPSAFSEPESQAVKYFTENHQFLMALNYHTYGNLLIYPWGYASSYYTPDSAVFVNFARKMTEQNHYTYGTGDQTVGYVTNGDSDDWMYGEQTTKNKILSFTPEAGSGTYGFWPPASAIEGLCQENLRQNLNFCQLALRFLNFSSGQPSTVQTSNFYYHYFVQRLGLDSTALFTLTFTPLSSNISSITPSIKTYNSINHLEQVEDSVNIQLASGINNGETITFIVHIDNQFYSYSDTVHITYGNLQISSQENFDSGTTNFTTTQWQLTPLDYYSAGYSMTDSPNGNYSNNATTETQLQTVVNLSDVTAAKATFYAKWNIETGYDYVEFLASVGTGNTWIPLCGKYTTIGNANQDDGQPLYEGFQNDWVKEEVDLSDFIGNSVVFFKFVLVSDGWVNEDGFYFDNFQIETSSDSSSTTRTDEKLRTAAINIFPNPATDKIQLYSDDAQNILSIEITDQLGQTIYAYNGLPESLSVENLAPGVYFIRCVSKDNIILKKFIKQ